MWAELWGACHSLLQDISGPLGPVTWGQGSVLAWLLMRLIFHSSMLSIRTSHEELTGLGARRGSHWRSILLACPGWVSYPGIPFLSHRLGCKHFSGVLISIYPRKQFATGLDAPSHLLAVHYKSMQVLQKEIKEKVVRGSFLRVSKR